MVPFLQNDVVPSLWCWSAGDHGALCLPLASEAPTTSTTRGAESESMVASASTHASSVFFPLAKNGLPWSHLHVAT